MATEQPELLYIFRHLFLPPKLPQQSDYDAKWDNTLLSVTVDGLRAWKECITPMRREYADLAISTIRNMQRAYSASDGFLQDSEIITLLTELKEDTAIPLLVREQNAGVLITRSSAGVQFDLFELSPTNEATLAAKGRLLRSFPGASVMINISEFQQPKFHEALAQALVDMSKYPVKAMQPKVKKAGDVLHEDRDTNHPGMVTEVLNGVLRSMGEPVECPAIVKNTRDDVLWKDARSPWRRTPSWLLVRVALQLGFHRTTTNDERDTTYKEAMLLIFCHVLKRATEQSLPSAVIFSMNAKIARRLLKIGPAIDPGALCYIESAMKDAYAVISERWSIIQNNQVQEAGIRALSDLGFINDIDVAIPQLDAYISWMGSRQREHSSSSFRPSSVLMTFPPQDLPQLPQYFPHESKSAAIANLEAFETWTACHCRQWSQNNLQVSCNKLMSLMTAYYDLATRYYKKNPEALSIMLLTILELWVACDDAAISLLPWLSEYDPGVPSDVLQHLLLPFVSQMERLYEVEKYLTNRSSSTLFPPEQLYYNLESPQCLPVRFFDQSAELQAEHRKIITSAHEEKQKKIKELGVLKETYNNLKSRASALECQYIMRGLKRRHSPNCKKCEYDYDAANLCIDVHEWPLPRSSTKAKAVLFELFIPEYFQSWRQATFYVLRNVIGMQYSEKPQSSPRCRYRLYADPHLPNGPSISSHIGLLSEEKPQVVTHRRGQTVSTATETSVCVHNGLNYRYFDSKADEFTHPFVSTDKILNMCTYRLPERSKALQKYLLRPHNLPDGPAPNLVLADQSEAPVHMSIEEMRDLATLSLGHHIQFHNILVQLAAPSLDFKKEETTIFILQCLYQSGPRGDTTLRASHVLLDDQRFISCLLENMEAVWHRTLYTGAFTWVGLLRDKSHRASTEDDRAFFKSKSVDIALICVSCFDVEDTHLSNLLESDSDASIFVQCSILIQEGKGINNQTSELTLSYLRLRFRRLLYRSLFILRTTHSGISDALKKSWSAYREGRVWRVADNAVHWLVTETESDIEGAHLQVHYNLLSGQVLVNGLPLSRPPPEYEAHPMWPILFGRVAVEVMPTSAAGMQFSAKRQHEGYGVQFGLNNTSPGSSDLLVQALKCGKKYEKIPARLFQGVFPDHFTHNFVHWYDCMNKIIEFRPLAAPWDSAGVECVLSRCDKSWRLERRGSAILSVSSITSTTIAKILSPVAKPFDIHVSRSLDEPRIEVDIPALRLGFFLTLGETNLESREFRGLSIDDDQALGTLIGFKNRLILRSENRRLVLLLEGAVSWQSRNGHIQVQVSRSSIAKVHALHVDSQLGRLIDNGDLQGKLFLSYLHALTSYCLPDPLTNKTGVEQSLCILTSASVQSFGVLSQNNIEILALIGGLTPRRQYYPKDNRVMQTISWAPHLDHMSQHDGFYKVVESIFVQAKQNSLFHPDLDPTQLDICCYIDTIEHLMERDRIRSSTFRIYGFGAEEHTTAYDVVYRSRDRDQISVRGCNAYVLSSIIYKERTTLHTDAPSAGSLWKFVSNAPIVLGPDQSLQVSLLEYSAEAANSGIDHSQWPGLHRLLSTQCAMANKFRLMIWLSAIASHEEADMRCLQVLALFFTADKLKDIDTSPIQSCFPAEGYEATSKVLEQVVRSKLLPFCDSPEAKMKVNKGESQVSFEKRREVQFRESTSNAVGTLVSQLRQQWPREILAPLDNVDPKVRDYVELKDIETTVRDRFIKWFRNRLLFKYLTRIEIVLSTFACDPITLNQPGPAAFVPPCRARAFVSVADLFAGPAPTLPLRPAPLELPPSFNHFEQQTPRLSELITALENIAPGSRYEASYIKDLHTSMESLQKQKNTRYPNLCDDYSIALLRQHLLDCKQSVDHLYYLLNLNAGFARSSTLEVGHGPRRCPLLFLQQLRNSSWKLLNRDWRVFISRYGLALTALQRAERMVEAASSRSNEALIKEMTNVGHRTWDPVEHPEWLLLEVESSIMIRDVQEQVASEMIRPSSHCNAVMQLNMGEGKSSVIVPMVATELADGSRLVRVIVAKPQSKQMAQMLTSKLGGLLGRRIYHMPFSRALRIESTEIAINIGKVIEECKNSGGILLVQPEHLLSFQLLGIECYCGSLDKQPIGMSLIRIRDFFDNNSRDIVDESDENFSPKFELVYTMGVQRPIEMSPIRWLCMQQVLDLVRSLAADVAVQAQESISISARNDGSFPKVRILKEDAGRLLVDRVASHICNKGFHGFPIVRQQDHVREAVFKYITKYDLSQEEINAAEEAGDGPLWTESTKSLLLLLRGILAGGVLTFVLSKRWRVNFGFATARTPPTKLAVPYRAKDNPTPRSEFSHPDVVIALTCLNYYYNGLENEDLFNALGNLVGSDQASIEYDAWIKDAPNMPASFRQLDGINLKDRSQCVNSVFPYLRYGKGVIDYFLGNIVFPKQIKEFPHKLSASGWDIGKTKAHYITGFSGTNDSRKLLPVDVKHIDLQSQIHTNALVLEYLLQPENSVVLIAAQCNVSMTDAEHLIKTVVGFQSPTRVILDVGAQILELNNEQVARAWLHMVTDAKTQAVVFVNDNDELCVLDRQGRLELLQISSYATRLDSCLVFLDEAHTRGIDLKLPNDYRAAVTLGANLSKDRLVQACMRMRNLGKGQSVVFCISAEIRAKIEERAALPAGATIQVRDVLHWAISETFEETRKSMPLWAAQGNRFSRQNEIWESAHVNGATSMSGTHAKQFLEAEALSIATRYGPQPLKAASIANIMHSKSQRTEEIVARCNEFENLNLRASSLEEEQERELSPEVERERQIQRPPPAQPAYHSLHQDVEKFIATGDLVPNSPAYMRAFDALHDTSGARNFETSQFSSAHLFVTADFAKTVQASDDTYVSNSFQRPVQWILSSHAANKNVVDVLMIISPYEAERLMPKVQLMKPGRVTLHLYKPRCHTVYRSFDRLDFFTIPDPQTKLTVPLPLIAELNVFAGQVYFSVYEDYIETCRFLGLANDVPKAGQNIAIDGYILRDSDVKPRFDKSPVNFIRFLMCTIRRNGQDISKTYVGSMLNGKLLQRSDVKE
ncbi:hypothetical protein F5Y07DRAFT_408682 [Xylaria sp. FL0933]|nr:hypothetical protein F5Y07DRAFT_408682 [Xylaria sp. FL0933]